ncbi:MAG: HD domain-containing protein [Desulfosarcina sp.]
MNILLADDDSAALNQLASHLGGWGHTVYPAADGPSLLKTLESTPVDMVISDRVLAGLNGLELCRLIRSGQATRSIYLILINRAQSTTDVGADLKKGVDDFLTRPIDPGALRARIETGARIVNLQRCINREAETISTAQSQVIRMFCRMMTLFDDDLGGHCRRTAALAVELAGRDPDVAESEIPVIETAALLHDIGMLGMPKRIRNKRRTEMVTEERNWFRSHAANGAEILAEFEIMKPAARLVRMHHEQYNGKGFPDGLSGDAIPLGAQLISAASIYDNMIHKAKIPPTGLADHLQHVRGYHLSPQVMLRLLETHVARLHERDRKTQSELNLVDLQAGMVLAANVHMNTGAFVMAAETVLDRYTIDKLNRFRTIGAISDKVLIHQSSMRP